jgi:hypothetical protein
MEEEDEDEESSSSSLAIPPIAYDLEKHENPDNANVEVSFKRHFSIGISDSN